VSEVRHTRQPVGALVFREPLFASADDTLRQLADRMYLESVGLLVIGTALEPEGVVSERDVVGAIARGAHPDEARARDIMTTAVAAVDPSDTMLDAALLMLDEGIRHLPLEHEGRVEGVVSVRDLLRPLILQAMTPPARTERAPVG
jgi:signal-transduction protein with cAMP-binding, CBS, and nucleotidyltransferase domain